MLVIPGDSTVCFTRLQCISVTDYVKLHKKDPGSFHEFCQISRLVHQDTTTLRQGPPCELVTRCRSVASGDYEALA